MLQLEAHKDDWSLTFSVVCRLELSMFADAFSLNSLDVFVGKHNFQGWMQTKRSFHPTRERPEMRDVPYWFAPAYQQSYNFIPSQLQSFSECSDNVSKEVLVTERKWCRLESTPAQGEGFKAPFDLQARPHRVWCLNPPDGSWKGSGNCRDWAPKTWDLEITKSRNPRLSSIVFNSLRLCADIWQKVGWTEINSAFGRKVFYYTIYKTLRLTKEHAFLALWPPVAACFAPIISNLVTLGCNTRD